MKIPGRMVQIKPGGGLAVDPVLGIYVTIAGGGGSEMEAGTALLDFGVDGSNVAKVVITGQTEITADSSIFVSKRLVNTGNEKALETMIKNVELGAMNIVPGVSFEIWGISRRGKQKGVLSVNWFWY